MNIPVCPRHRSVMEQVPAVRCTPCPNCEAAQRDEASEFCPQCGCRITAQDPVLSWRCPICHDTDTTWSIA
jgi:hypothetical protein